MGASALLSRILLDTADARAPAAVESATLSEFEAYGMEFYLHAAFIWAALLIIGVIVFGYRKATKAGKSEVPDAYEQELRAMRRGDPRHH